MLNNQEIKMPVLIEDLGMMYANNDSKRKSRYGLFLCFCGKEFKAQLSNVNRGTKSCGCFRDNMDKSYAVHMMSKHRLYQTWSGMITRVTNKNRKSFEYYGARGIKVCERWLDIRNFIEDMYPSYEEGLSIDRINNDGNYEPSNCRWANDTTQARNKRIIQKNNKSGFCGVTFNKEKNKWCASITINSKQKYIGSFYLPIDAAKAYDKYVIDNNLEHTINGVLL